MRRWSVVLACTGLLGLQIGLAHADEQVPEQERPALIKQIDGQREAIESRRDQMQRTTLSTANLREQIKQKWSKFDFYTDAGKVVRIKSYPHEGISARTEEFYFQDGQLIFAYIEDVGTAEEKPGALSGGKAYYYHQGRFIEERNQTGESEQSIRHSDEERLEQEAAEYLALYTRTQKAD